MGYVGIEGAPGPANSKSVVAVGPKAGGVAVLIATVAAECRWWSGENGPSGKIAIYETKLLGDGSTLEVFPDAGR